MTSLHPYLHHDGHAAIYAAIGLDVSMASLRDVIDRLPVPSFLSHSQAHIPPAFAESTFGLNAGAVTRYLLPLLNLSRTA
jgi:hypothetical protein